MGCALKRKDVTTPKLPPPPRTAQKRSEFSLALAVTKRPSARTKSTARRLSIVRTYCRVSAPIPTAECEPAHAGRRNNPRRNGETECMRCVIDIAPQRSAAYKYSALLRVNPDILYW